MQQRVELKRLGDEVCCALLDRVDRVLHGAVTGDHDRDDVGVALEGGVEHLPAVDAGEAEVGDEDIEGEVRQAAEGLLATVGLLDREPLIRQLLRHRLTQGLFVVYDQQMFRRFSHLVGLPVF